MSVPQFTRSMSTRFSSLLPAAMAAFTLTSAPAAAQDTLVWSDEFNGTTLNPKNWEAMIGTGTNYGLPAGWGNNELQYYTSRTDNVYVGGGALHIIARRENYAGSQYTSARLRSRERQAFQYGRYEIRARIPGTTGIWPALWMLPENSPYGGWASSGEIDIMESTNAADRIHGTLHFGGQWPNNTSHGGSYADGTDFSQDFHVYAVQWTPEEMRWFIDGQLYHVASNASWWSSGAPGDPDAPFDVPFHFLMNVAVGGDWPGNPNGSSVFPQEMTVDWIRVYQSEQGPYPDPKQPARIPGTVLARDYDSGGQGLAYNDCDATNNGGDYRPNEGVDLQASSIGGHNIGWMCEDEWVEYTVNVAVAGQYELEVLVATESTGGAFHLEFDGADRTGPILVSATGGWQQWATAAPFIPVTLEKGEQIMRFVNDSDTSFNVHSFRFRRVRPPLQELSR